MLSAVLSVVGLVINELMAANVGIKVLWIGSYNIRGDQAPLKFITNKITTE